MRALVLPGGGALGAYQVGAVGFLLGEMKVDYPIMTGVSVGAINVGVLAQYADPLEGSRELAKVDLTFGMLTQGGGTGELTRADSLGTTALQTIQQSQAAFSGSGLKLASITDPAWTAGSASDRWAGTLRSAGWGSCGPPHQPHVRRGHARRDRHPRIDRVIRVVPLDH